MPSNSEQPHFPVPILPFFGQDFFQAAARLQVHGLKAAMQYQIEALTFLKRRYEQDMKFLNDLAGSEQSKDAFDVVAAFIQSATTEYAVEAGKITSIGAKLALETANRMRREAERATEDRAAATAA